MRLRVNQMLGVAAVFVTMPVRAQNTPIDRVSWLAGCWEQRSPNRLTMEMWMPPAGGTMMGASRTTIGVPRD